MRENILRESHTHRKTSTHKKVCMYIYTKSLKVEGTTTQDR